MNWIALHEAMLLEIESGRNSCVNELAHVENAFAIAVSYWYEIKIQLKNFFFESKEHEINFYKNIKPKFTGYIEYMTLSNHGLLLVNDENKEFEKDYWQRELQTFHRFVEKNLFFVDYYNNKQTHHDTQYFLPENYDLTKSAVSKPYDNEPQFMTSHCHVVACYLAQQMYHQYVKEKLAIKFNTDFINTDNGEVIQ